uniref:DPPIV_N domain-containing protein n=1 Tax=Rhabditophanes sp. KR3021 TaxID=114890 RepID=A0AC35TWA2_9BILA
MKSDGSEVKQITGTVGFELNPVWSPDGTRILYAGFQPKMGDPYAQYLQLLKLNFIDTTKTELFIVDKDGQNWQRLTNFNSSIWHPTWVDDKTVIFSSDYDILTLKSLNDPQIQFLYSFNIESKELVRLTENNLFGFDSFPTYDYNTGILIWTSNRIQQEKSTKLSYDIYMASLNQPPRHPFFVDGLHHEHKQQNTVKYHLKKKSLIYEGEDHFESLKQLTFGGQNAEGYFTKDDTEMIFQAMGRNIYGTDCDQIYRHQLIPIFPNEKTIPQRMSTGLGACTCSYLFPDHQTSLYAGSFRAVNFSSSLENGACPSKKCKSKLAETDPVLKGLCNTSYVWDIIPDYDIFKVGKFGEFIKQLTDTEGYDAEATISPDGKLIVYTSMASGDLDLWLMDSNGDNKQQITTAIGYDGGAFFSPDGTKLIFLMI